MESGRKRGSSIDSSVAQETLDDFFGEHLAEPVGPASLAFPSVGDETAFDEDGRHLRQFEDLEAFRSETTVPGDETATQFALDETGKFMTLLAARPVECLGPSDAAILVGVEMEAEKEGSWKPVRHLGTGGQIDEDVRAPRQFDRNTLSDEDPLDAESKVQGEVFFHEVEGDRSRVLAPVTRVDHDPVETTLAKSGSRAAPSKEEARDWSEEGPDHSSGRVAKLSGRVEKLIKIS